MRALTPRQQALLSAAARHVADAERLLAAPHASPDQAWHLAGFGPECARKACLDERVIDLALGHGFGLDGEALLEWWIPLDPAAWRHHIAGWAQVEPLLAAWSPNHRYEPTGTRVGRPVEALTASARRLVDAVVADLWCDGRLKQGTF